MSELVTKLAEGDHPVVVGGSQPTLEELKRRLTEMRYVFIKFTDTRGGTDLGFQVDEEATRHEGADFEQGTGTIHVEGHLKLDYVPVTVVADVDLATLSGTGHLLIRQEDADTTVM
jgi:hypothetical protein